MVYTDGKVLPPPLMILQTRMELQRKAFERAIFLGMKPDEAKEVEERRSEIYALIDRLDSLSSER